VAIGRLVSVWVKFATSTNGQTIIADDDGGGSNPKWLLSYGVEQAGHLTFTELRSWAECVPDFHFWMAAQMTAAVGLLKLKEWGLFTTIGLQCLAMINAALVVIIPTHRERIQQIMETMIASMNARTPYPAPFVFPIWVGYAMSFPIMFVILWLLVTRKRAFTS
jgi:hypothetical protein